MSTKKKNPAKKPDAKKSPEIPRPTLKETSMALVSKLTNAVICGNGDDVAQVNKELDALLKTIQEKRDAEVERRDKCKHEIAILSAEILGHYHNISELDRLKIDTQAALGSIASLGERYREK